MKNPIVSRTCSCGTNYRGGRSSTGCPRCCEQRRRARLNTIQLSALRAADAGGVIGCDRSTGKALVDRGFAQEISHNFFQITDAGRDRARLKADEVKIPSNATFVDPSLLKDLPSPSPASSVRAFVIDDDDYWFEQWKEELSAAIPHAKIDRFQDAISAHSSSFTPDLLVIDLSSVAPVQMSHAAYSPICSLLSKWPNVTVIITSAIGYTCGNYVREDILERMPDADVRVGTFFDEEPSHFVEVLRKWCEQRSISPSVSPCLSGERKS